MKQWYSNTNKKISKLLLKENSKNIIIARKYYAELIIYPWKPSGQLQTAFQPVCGQTSGGLYAFTKRNYLLSAM